MKSGLIKQEKRKFKTTKKGARWLHLFRETMKYLKPEGTANHPKLIIDETQIAIEEQRRWKRKENKSCKT